MGLSYVAAMIVFIMINDVAADGNFTFSCDDVNMTGPLLFTSSDAYSYEVLISIDGKNETIEAHELFDMENDNIFLYVHYPDKNGKDWVTEVIHHDYKHNQTFKVYPDSKTCNVTELMADQTYSLFGMGIENGFNDPEYVYRWKGSYNYTEGEATMVNGIQTIKQSTCLTFNNDSIRYDVDVYFSDDGWKMKTNGSTPLMVVLKVNQTKDLGLNFTNEKYTYAFSGYSEGDDIHHGRDMSNFIPSNMICEGRKDVADFPGVHNNIVATVELFRPKAKKIMTSKHYYNYDEKLTRLDFVAQKSSPNATVPFYHHPYSIIHDFHAGIEYIIDRELGNCTMKPITDANIWDVYDVGKDSEGYFHMRNIMDITKQRNMTYTGRRASRHNEITFQSWTSTVPLTGVHNNVTYEINETFIYTTPDWSNGDLSPVLFTLNQDQKLTFQNGTVTTSKMIFHYSGARPLNHYTNQFEVGMCHRGNARKSIVLKFSSTYNQYIGPYSTQIDVAMQEAVAKAAGVPKIRVSSYISKELGMDGTSDDKLFFTVTLYDGLDFHGNTSEYTPGINLTDAVQNLKKNVESNQLQVQFDQNTGETVIMTAYSDYFVERSSLYAPPPPKQPKSLSSGAVAGIAIGMVVVGIIIGAMIVHFRYKRGNQQFAYGIQD